MLKIKPWLVWLFAAACFLFIGIVHFSEKNNFRGFTFTLIGVGYVFISISNFKWKNKHVEIELSDEVLKDMDIELSSLIIKGEKIKAIKRYRMLTGCDLRVAKDYIDSLSNETRKD